MVNIGPDEHRKVEDKAAHYILGIWIGSIINEPKLRHGAYILFGGFLAYQISEAWRKGDEAYREIKEWLIGIAAALMVIRVWRWWKKTGRFYWMALMETTKEKK